MKSILSIARGFLPWILFAVLAGPTLSRLSLSLEVAFGASIVFGFRELRKGFILIWGSLIFFGVCIVAVALLKNIWFAENMSILANGALAVITWTSIAVGKPFVLQYAHEKASPDQWDTPLFHRICRDISTIWGLIFTISAILNIFTPHCETIALIYPVWMAVSMVFGMFFNGWYPKFVKGRLQKGQVEANPG